MLFIFFSHEGIFYFLLSIQEVNTGFAKNWISGFRRIYTFYKSLNTIWLRLENIHLYVCLHLCFVCMSVFDTNFEAVLSQNLLQRIWWNFTSCFILVWTGLWLFLSKIFQEVLLQIYDLFDLCDAYISGLWAQNSTKHKI